MRQHGECYVADPAAAAAAAAVYQLFDTLGDCSRVTQLRTR